MQIERAGISKNTKSLCNRVTEGFQISRKDGHKYVYVQRRYIQRIGNWFYNEGIAVY
jgi:hypothetical protein